MTLPIRERVPLARYCTLGVGGPARYFLEARTEAEVAAGVRWARERGVPLYVLGGGSNLVVADAGVEGLVLRIALRGLRVRRGAGAVELTAGAGEVWDDVVRLAVDRDWAGIECLSGIPGLVGATPIQNVGAYGQEVADTVVAVRVLDRQVGEIVDLSPEACEFAYRDSVFRSREPDRYVVLAVTYRLHPGGSPTLVYEELVRALTARGSGPRPGLGTVRECVLAVRRAKSMLLEEGDENRRSCGSFFLNPVVSEEDAARIAALAGDPAMPRWILPDGRVKLAAAWLIERAGFRRGHTEGPVGLSSRHALALVCREGATAADLVGLARRVRAAVEARFGVRLRPEPVFWGFETLDEGLPVAA